MWILVCTSKTTSSAVFFFLHYYYLFFSFYFPLNVRINAIFSHKCFENWFTYVSESFFFLLQLQSKSIICQQKCVLVIASYEKSIQKLTQSMTLNGIRYGITQLFQSHSALYVNASKRRKKNKTKKISFEM